MNIKTRLYLRIIIGAYLVYLGATVIRGAVTDKISHAFLVASAGAVFIVFGVCMAVLTARRLYKGDYEETDLKEDGDEEEENTDKLE